MISENVSLKPYTTYKTGGNARYFAKPTNIIELLDALSFANDNAIPYEILGGGANVLISDDGYNGLIISTLELDNSLTHKDNLISVGASKPLSALVMYAINNSLSGIEKLIGIPGSVGGAIMMNAGAYGVEVKDVLESVLVLGANGEVTKLSNTECLFGYRKSEGLDGCIVLNATFKLEHGDKALLEQTKSEILKTRAEKQPLDKPSCGSVFKRPEGNYAGTLIEQAGLKGKRIGGAMISDKHANFILNVDNATSSDILALIELAKAEVMRGSGVALECEVRILNPK